MKNALRLFLVELGYGLIIYFVYFFVPVGLVPVAITVLALLSGGMIARRFTTEEKGDVWGKLRSVFNHVVFMIIPSQRRVLMLPAKKELAENKVIVKTLRKGRYEEHEIFLGPEHEFLLSTPNIEVKEYYPVWEVLQDWDVYFELKDPVKQTFRIDPLDIEASFIVFPSEVLSKEQLENWVLKEEKETEAVEVPEVVVNPATGERQEIKKVIEIPVYSPTPYAISVDGARHFQAIHRGSPLNIIREETRKILERSDTLGGTGSKGGSQLFGKVFAFFAENPWKTLMLLLTAVIILFFIAVVPNMLGAMAGAAQKMQHIGEVNRVVWPP